MRSRIVPSLFILAFLAVQTVFMVRCYSQPAKFFGWQMFSYGLRYRMTITVTDTTGQAAPIDPAIYRHAVGTHFYRTARPVPTWRLYSRGRDFFISEVARLPAFLCGKLPDIRRVDVTLEYREPREPVSSQQTFTQACDA